MLAPNARLRALVVPQAPEVATSESELTATESSCTPSRPAQLKIIAAVFEAAVIERSAIDGQARAVGQSIQAAPGVTLTRRR